MYYYYYYYYYYHHHHHHHQWEQSSMRTSPYKIAFEKTVVRPGRNIYNFHVFRRFIRLENRDTAVGIHHADHVTPSIRKGWHWLRPQAAVARSVYFARGLRPRRRLSNKLVAAHWQPRCWVIPTHTLGLCSSHW
jgi:hypothetical protein